MTIQEFNELKYFRERIIKLIKVKYNNADLLIEIINEFDRMYENLLCQIGQCNGTQS